MGLDISLNGTKDVSAKYPDHMCSPTYLRSSYNGGGYNSVVKSLIGQDLYDVFEPPAGLFDDDVPSPDMDDDWNWHPSQAHLEGALARAKEQALLIADAPPLGVITVAIEQMFGPVDCSLEPHDAIALAKEEVLDKESNAFSSYSNARGHFFSEGLAVVMAAPGREFGTTKGVHLVYLRSEEDMAYYCQMSEIVVEFIEHALELDDAVISWSG